MLLNANLNVNQAENNVMFTLQNYTSTTFEKQANKYLNELFLNTHS